MILVSGCLIGQKCRYNMLTEEIPELKQMVERGEAVPICPEQLGGLPTPRPPAEIKGGEGGHVINGRAKVINSEGIDVTKHFIKGASDTLVVAKDNNVTHAVFKTRSPACGCGKIYDGTFSGTLKEGDGVTTALLKSHGIKVVTEEQYGSISTGF